LSPVGSLRTFLPLALLASILFAGAAGCSRAGDGSIAVQLVYPSPPGAAAASRASVRAASYATDPADRIRIRVLAPHFAPIEKWFLRSDVHGEIGGIPPGTRITVEVDEYDNTATPSDNAVIAARLLGRGWFNGITLSPGEVKTVAVAMYAKGTIVTICGAPASGVGYGTAGDSGDGGLDNEARLGDPIAVKIAPDDSLLISSMRYGRLRRVDRYGYVSNFGGSLTYAPFINGTSMDNATTGQLFDIDFDIYGNMYVINQWQDIYKINYTNKATNLFYNSGIFVSNPGPNLAVVNLDIVYYTDGFGNNVYYVSNGIRNIFINGSTSIPVFDNTLRINYLSRFPNGICSSVSDNSSKVIFCDTDHDMIKLVSFREDVVETMVGSQIFSPFSNDGVDPLTMTPVRPRVVDYNPITGKIFFVEAGLNTSRVLYVDALGKVRVLAGTGTLGFSGDGDPATLAMLSDPRAITVDSRGNAYIADYGNHTVRMVVGGALP